MISLLLKILQAILLKLVTTGVFNFMLPSLLKVDKYLENKLGIDIIKQDKKFKEVYPLIGERLIRLEQEVDRLKHEQRKEQRKDSIS
jgi:hypothetical protein